jgi:hypothetical protein
MALMNQKCYNINFSILKVNVITLTNYIFEDDDLHYTLKRGLVWMFSREIVAIYLKTHYYPHFISNNANEIFIIAT